MRKTAHRPAGWLVVLSTLALPASGKELWEYEWIELQTPHFVIASAQDAKKTAELAQELEDFRKMVGVFSNIGRFEERVPTRILLLPRGERDLGFDGKIAGFFDDGMRSNYAAMIPSGSFSDEVLKHEYIHFLIHNRSEQLYPTWFDEGFADFFASMRVHRDQFEYGKPMAVRASWLVNGAWMPYETVLEARDTSKFGRDRGAMFYAQAWLLVHFLMLEKRDFGPRNTDYLARRERGEPPLAAFEAAFSLDPKLLGSRLARYLPKLHYWRGTLKAPFPAVEIRARPMKPAEIAAELGMLALRIRGPDAARRYYEAALAADPNHGPALTGVGDLNKFAGRFTEAKPYYEKAIALEPDVADHELDYAEYFLDLARLEKDAGERVEAIREARRHFKRSYQLNPNNPETLAMNGASYLVEGEDATKAVASLEEAYHLLPSQADIRFLLAQAYAGSGEPAKARRQLETLLAWTHAEGVEEIQKLLSGLDDETGAPSEATKPETAATQNGSAD